MDDSISRHVLFEAAQVRAEWTVRELWLKYIGLGGEHGAFELEAYLAGLAPLDVAQQNFLAVALNERLDDVYRAVCVPYLQTSPDDRCAPSSVPTVLDDLLTQQGTNPRPVHQPPQTGTE